MGAFRFLNYMGWRIEQWLERKCQIDCYRLENDSIVKTKGLFRRDYTRISDIVAWWVVHEMTFDIIYLRLANAQLVQWHDVRGDLLDLLRSVAGEKQIEE